MDKSIRVYVPGPHGAKLVHSVFAHQEPVQKILFAPDSKTLYSVGQGGTLKAWDVERMVERKVYDRQPETELCMAMPRKGNHIALGRHDGIVVILDEATGELLAQIGANLPAPKQFVPKKDAKVVPKITSTEPAAVARGKSTRVFLVGSNLLHVTDIASNVPGATLVWTISGQKTLAVTVTPPAMVSPGKYQLELKTTITCWEVDLCAASRRRL